MSSSWRARPAPALGRLQQVDLRAAWLSEAGGFTPWLAQEENLALLGEMIAIDLELEAQEHSFLKSQNALPRYAMYLSIGRSGAQLMASVSAREPWIQAAVTFNDSKRDEQWFPLLLQQREEIDRELGVDLPWDNPPFGYKEGRMAIRLHDADFHNRSDWPRQHTWLREKLEVLHRVFAPRIKALLSPEVQTQSEISANLTAETSA